MSRIDFIREAERQYHEACYDRHGLFEAGSWLSKPVKTVMDLFASFDAHSHVDVLDLGCGVGRNSIPLAERLGQRPGKIVCVDLPESALQKLNENAAKFGVQSKIDSVAADIGEFLIAEGAFDYIVAVSALEHVRSETALVQTLQNMKRGTTPGGINVIIVNTNVKETDRLTGEAFDPLMELNLSTSQATAYLSQVYEGWTVVQSGVKPLTFEIERGERKIHLQSECLTRAVQRHS